MSFSSGLTTFPVRCRFFPFVHEGDDMLELMPLKRLRSVICAVVVLLCANSHVAAQEEGGGSVQAVDDSDGIPGQFLLNGLTLGRDTKVYPYVTMGELFDFYGGMVINHPAFWNDSDRMVHGIKFENFTDFSWKFKYIAHSLSSENTRFSFLFKTKSGDEDYFYGIGGATSKSERKDASYSSIFFGLELQQNLSDGVAFRWSPGFWSFQSGLEEGGEFERASDARYLTSRFTLLDRTPMDYRRAGSEHQWTAYLEVGVPVNTSASSYTRFNLESFARLPVYKKSKIGIGGRLETIFSGNRALVPYNALPEVGSRSGLRAFSKERFRNFSLAVLNLEYSVQFSQNFETFLLTDIASTAADPQKLLSGEVHRDFGIGLRLLDSRFPVSAGLATGDEGWKLFTTISVGWQER